MKPVSIITVAYDTVFFVRLLVTKVREFIGQRPYEIILVDRGSSDGTLSWCAEQADVRVLSFPQNDARHGHAAAAEQGIRAARHEIIVLLDSDAHPITHDWLTLTVDELDARCRLAGPKYHGAHRGNPFGWYVHPHFMVFFARDFGEDIILEKIRGETTDTGEEATVRLLEKGKTIAALPLESCPTLAQTHPHSAYRRFAFGHPHFPTICAGVFHAWYGTRLKKDLEVVEAETDGEITPGNYQQPIINTLREFYRLDF